MALQYPAIAPVGYALDYTDFLKTKVDKGGQERLITGQVNVPSGTLSGAIIGLFPFNKGFKLDYAAAFNFAALGTSVTAALGWYYNDSTLTSNTAGYLAASATAAAGGTVSPIVAAGMIQDMVADGWVVAVIGGATTTSAGFITYNASFAYDISGVTN